MTGRINKSMHDRVRQYRSVSFFGRCQSSYKSHFFVFLVSNTMMSVSIAQDPLPLEEYGELPEISQMALSPDASKIAYRNTSAEADVVVVQNIASGEIVGVTSVAAVNMERIKFLTEDKVVLLASQSRRINTIGVRYDFSSAFLFDLETGKSAQLLQNQKGLALQSGLGRISGIGSDKKSVLMPAYTLRKGQDSRYSLLDVNVKRRRGGVVARGSSITRDWFVDGEGRPLIEEDFDELKDRHRVWVYDGKKRRLLFEEETERRLRNFVGLTPSRDALLFTSYRENSDFTSFYRMNLTDGEVEGPLFERDNASVALSIVDFNRVVYGVEYSGLAPTYEFFDEVLDARVRQLTEAYEGTATRLIDWTPGFENLLFRISGGWNSGLYILLKEGASKPVVLANIRPAITPALVSRTQVVEYIARDGLMIPALVTAKSNVVEGGAAPLIVLPHGGPRAHDRLDFDWLTQYLASRGYVVLRPQFRGSSGFGYSFTKAGYAEWGRKMSTDVDDGVAYLSDQGLIDPTRVCIVGASYGGYAALSAGANSDIDYQCVVSIAGVSDVGRMFREIRQNVGSKHSTYLFWQEQFGSSAGEKQALNAMSPLHQASDIKVPVLLIHGYNDIVVPIMQSTLMRRALEKVNTPVEFIELKGEDHYLRMGESRLQVLAALEQFLGEYLPAN